LYQVGDLFQLNVKLRCQKFKDSHVTFYSLHLLNFACIFTV